MNKLSNFISSLHNSEDENAPWQQFANKTSDFFDADGCLFSFREIKQPDAPIAVSIAKFDEQQARQIISTTSQSPYYRLLRRSAVGKIICNGDIKTDRKTDLGVYFDKVLQSGSLDQVMGAIVYRDERYEAFLSITRTEARKTFDRHEYQLFDAFLPYLGQLTEKHFDHYIRPKAPDVSVFIEQFNQNLAILDSRSNILQHNSAFEQLKLRKSLLYVYGGKVNFYDKAAQQWLTAILRDEKNVPGQQHIFIIDHDGQQMVVKLKHFELQKSRIKALNLPFILSIDNEDIDQRLKQYRQLFNLTRAEALLAAELSQGKSINQLADNKLLSKHTLRTQLKSVFGKTKTHSQNELVVLLKNVV